MSNSIKIGKEDSKYAYGISTVTSSASFKTAYRDSDDRLTLVNMAEQKEAHIGNQTITKGPGVVAKNGKVSLAYREDEGSRHRRGRGLMGELHDARGGS